VRLRALSAPRSKSIFAVACSAQRNCEPRPLALRAASLTSLGAQMSISIGTNYQAETDATVYHGDCRELLAQIPDATAQLVVTSPPYNLGKRYESRVALKDYLRREREVINQCIDKLAPGGSICWQVGNHVDSGEVYPIDILIYEFFKERGLSLRNRIVWHFEHGLHCTQRFSGRYETILWFTRPNDRHEYVFNLDPVRVPQKYPGKKHFKGKRKGEPSANPLGKNPGDVWIIPNVKHNHPEKTTHPCQFPIELVERLVLALTNPGDLVLDPYMGVGSTLAAAVLNGRRAAGADTMKEYVSIARTRLEQAAKGTLPMRPRTRPVYTPPPDSPLTRRPW
jgi:adenine-specific DNA-methyltransferase